MVFAVRVLKPADGTKPELTGNLMKMGTVNTAGQAQSYRDQADFNVAPPPDLGIIKGVVATNKPAGTTWSMPTTTGLDSRVVQQGSTSTFRVDVKNNIDRKECGVVGLETWDQLPAGSTAR